LEGESAHRKAARQYNTEKGGHTTMHRAEFEPTIPYIRADYYYCCCCFNIICILSIMQSALHYT